MASQQQTEIHFIRNTSKLNKSTAICEIISWNYLGVSVSIYFLNVFIYIYIVVLFSIQPPLYRYIYSTFVIMEQNGQADDKR